MEKKHTTKDLEKAIEKMHIGGSIQFVECFHNFLDLALSYFCNNMNERQMALRKRVEENEDFRKAYQEALEAYGDCAENYKDPMGDMFMDKISHGQHGQFFTPEDLCVLCADILGIGDGNSVSDPCCGSGRMLLAALKKAREVDGNEPKLYANDLSMTFAKMTLLNFCVNSVDGEVTCGDTLRLDYENFMFFKIDKVLNTYTGQILSTYWQYTKDTVGEVQEKRKKWWLWIAEHGWIKYLHINKKEMERFIEGLGIADFSNTEMKVVTLDDKKEINAQELDPLPTEVKVGRQLSLFD